MGKRLTMVFVALAGIAVGYLMNGNGVEAQSRRAAVRRCSG